MYAFGQNFFSLQPYELYGQPLALLSETTAKSKSKTYHIFKRCSVLLLFSSMQQRYKKSTLETILDLVQNRVKI